MSRDFKCQRCGACCRIKDGIVRVSEAEIASIAAFLGMGESDFIERETEIAPDRKSLMLKSLPDGSCAYLTAENLCRINPAKPDKCRTFPFEWETPTRNWFVQRMETKYFVSLPVDLTPRIMV